MPTFETPLDNAVPLNIEVLLRRDVPLRSECPDAIALPLPLSAAPLRRALLVVDGVVDDLRLLADTLALMMFLLSDRFERLIPWG